MNILPQLLLTLLLALPMLALPTIAQARRGKRRMAPPVAASGAWPESHRRRRYGYYRLAGCFVRAWR